MSDTNKKSKCPVCGSKSSEKYWAMRGYRLSKCLDCTMVWDHIPPEDPLAQYKKNYFINENPKGGYANYFEGMRVNRKTFTHRLKRISDKRGKDSLLDVGCALGDCLIEAKKLGWENPKGIEVSEYAYKFAKKRGLDVENKTLKNGDFEPNSFGVVTYQDVIEHVSDPVSELKNAKKVLKKGGLVFLVTPDVGGLWNKLLGPLWYHYKPGEHIMYFSQESLRKALEAAGFVDIETRRTYHVLSIEYIFNRLKYYSPPIFGSLLKLAKKLSLENVSFKSYTGEIEAWANKPS